MVSSTRQPLPPKQEELFQKWRKEVCNYLLTCKLGVEYRKLRNLIAEVTGIDVPVQEMGLTWETFLYEFNEDFELGVILSDDPKDRYTRKFLFLRYDSCDPEQRNILDLVRQQEKGKTKKRRDGQISEPTRNQVRIIRPEILRSTVSRNYPPPPLPTGLQRVPFKPRNNTSNHTFRPRFNHATQPFKSSQDPRVRANFTYQPSMGSQDPRVRANVASQPLMGSQDPRVRANVASQPLMGCQDPRVRANVASQPLMGSQDPRVKANVAPQPLMSSPERRATPVIQPLMSNPERPATPKPQPLMSSPDRRANIDPQPLMSTQDKVLRVNVDPQPLKISQDKVLRVNLDPQPLMSSQSRRSNIDPQPVMNGQDRVLRVNLDPQPISSQNGERRYSRTSEVQNKGPLDQVRRLNIDSLPERVEKVNVSVDSNDSRTVLARDLQERYETLKISFDSNDNRTVQAKYLPEQFETLKISVGTNDTRTVKARVEDTSSLYSVLEDSDEEYLGSFKSPVKDDTITYERFNSLKMDDLDVPDSSFCKPDSLEICPQVVPKKGQMWHVLVHDICEKSADYKVLLRKPKESEDVENLETKMTEYYTNGTGKSFVVRGRPQRGFYAVYSAQMKKWVRGELLQDGESKLVTVFYIDHGIFRVADVDKEELRYLAEEFTKVPRTIYFGNIFYRDANVLKEKFNKYPLVCYCRGAGRHGPSNTPILYGLMNEAFENCTSPFER